MLSPHSCRDKPRRGRASHFGWCVPPRYAKTRLSRLLALLSASSKPPCPPAPGADCPASARKSDPNRTNHIASCCHSPPPFWTLATKLARRAIRKEPLAPTSGLVGRIASPTGAPKTQSSQPPEFEEKTGIFNRRRRRLAQKEDVKRCPLQSPRLRTAQCPCPA
jgi:hypothetical protein